MEVCAVGNVGPNYPHLHSNRVNDVIECDGQKQRPYRSKTELIMRRVMRSVIFPRTFEVAQIRWMWLYIAGYGWIWLDMAGYGWIWVDMGRYGCILDVF